ncbi:hypothetical protein [Devosia nitrariae]|nr:hypothetical protein [Devosia nitrariae]
MSRPSLPSFAWPLARPAEFSAIDVPARTVPLRDRDPRRIKLVIDGGMARIGYAILGSLPDGEWRIEGPMRAEDGLARAQVLSSVAGLPIILSRSKGDCSFGLDRERAAGTHL